jgi:uncharacterized protein (TIGR02001 family)
MKLSTIALASTLLVASTAALAQTKAPEPDYTLSFNAALTSDYRYRGISQSRLKPAVSGGVDFAHKSGFYVGAWGSSIKWIKDFGGDASMEVDLYGGYKGSISDSVSYDVGVLGYIYPSNRLTPSTNTTEVYGALTVGPVTAKYSHSTTNLFGLAGSKGSGYLDLSASFDLGGGWSIAPHLGHQRAAGAGNSIASYTDYSLALSKDFGGGLVGTAALVGTDASKVFYASPANGKFLGKDGLVLTVKYSF